jgi:hypothetical protein
MVIATSKRIAGLAGALALMAGFSASDAAAQFYPRPFFYGGYYSGPIVVPVPRRPVGSPVGDIMEDLRDQGFRQITLSGRRPDVLIVDALDRNRRPVRLIVDAYDGEILERYARDAGPGPRNTAGLSPETRLPRETPRANRPETNPGEPATPLPPRRPDGMAQAPAGSANPLTGRPAPVAPARDPSLWAPSAPAPSQKQGQ